MIKIFLYGSLIITAILSFGTLFWWRYPLELFSHFRVYYLLAASVIAIACLILQLKKLRVGLPLLLALGLFAFNSAWIVPWYLPHSQQGSQQGSGNAVRVLTFNINVDNDHWDAIANAIRTVKPDVATLIESSVQSKEEVSQRLADLFPFVYRSSGGGLTILSRFPLISPQSKTFDHGTALITALQINQRAVEFIAVHPLVPVKPSLFKRRNAFLAELTAYIQQQVQQQQKSLILLGDFNLTPWSPYYSRLIHKTGLHNTRLGFGIEPSWIEPATHVHYPNWITALIKIPIDHIFVSQDFKVLNCKTIKAANSDHRMLWSDLELSYQSTK